MQIRQINDEGQALQGGLDVFVSIPVYSGEYLTFGNSFLLQTLTGAPDYASSTADYAAEVIDNAPPTTLNTWYRYHTEGTLYPAVIAPSTTTNMLTMLGVYSAASSHSGMYQKLSGLVTGLEYQVTINFHDISAIGTITFSRFYYANQNFTTAIQTEVTTYEIPSKQATFTFTAKSTSDIVFFDYSTTEASESCTISSIEIKEKNNYQIPVIVDLQRIGFAKVLRRNYNESDFFDVGEPKE
jgi:hypothetical protein